MCMAGSYETSSVSIPRPHFVNMSKQHTSGSNKLNCWVKGAWGIPVKLSIGDLEQREVAHLSLIWSHSRAFFRDRRGNLESGDQGTFSGMEIAKGMKDGVELGRARTWNFRLRKGSEIEIMSPSRLGIVQ